MISFVTTCKPFIGHFKTIQLNALNSWLRFCPPCEVIIVGEEEGLYDALNMLSHDALQKGLIKIIPDVQRNEFGTPLLNDILSRAYNSANNEIICLINADCILVNDPTEIVHHIKNRFDRFLIITCSFNINVSSALNFNDPETIAMLKNLPIDENPVKMVFPVDTFIFPRGTFENVPPFAIGRGVYARWFVAEAFFNKIPIIDATYTLIVRHQVHDYQHLKSVDKSIVQSNPKNPYIHSTEFVYNAKLAGWASYFSHKDATHRITTDGKISRNLSPASITRRVMKRLIMRGLHKYVLSRGMRVTLKRFLRRHGYIG